MVFIHSYTYCTISISVLFVLFVKGSFRGFYFGDEIEFLFANTIDVSRQFDLEDCVYNVDDLQR
jgi:hypothetical protein